MAKINKPLTPTSVLQYIIDHGLIESVINIDNYESIEDFLEDYDAIRDKEAIRIVREYQTMFKDGDIIIEVMDGSRAITLNREYKYVCIYQDDEDYYIILHNVAGIK